MATKSQLTPEALKNLVKNHPEIIDELVKDEEIVSIIGTRIMSSKLPESEDAKWPRKKRVLAAAEKDRI